MRREYLVAFPLLLAIPCVLGCWRTPRRLKKVRPAGERVLVLGASSGIGRAVANLYAARSARVCVVGRRKDKLDEVVEECRRTDCENRDSGGVVIGVAADFANVKDMVRVRDILEKGTNLRLFFSWMNPGDSVISL